MPKYSDPDISDKKRINLHINKIPPNDDINNNYRTSVNFFKNIKSNSRANIDYDWTINENKNSFNRLKTKSQSNLFYLINISK